MMWLVVEPLLRKALVIEDARNARAMSGHRKGEMEEPLVSRAGQVLGGMATGLVVGLLFGVVFAIVFGKVRHRLPAATDYGRSLVLAVLAFGVFTLAPALKIPGNPPAVGDPATVNQRTLIYVLTILIALALVLGAFELDKFLASRDLSAPVRTTLVVAAFLSVAGAVFALTPGTPDKIASDMPAKLIWDFRIAYLAQLGLMWATLGMVFGLLLTPRRARVPTGSEVSIA
ncbi:putative cobalt transporter CbtA [Nocardioides panzhihuensis]|uniref:Putative cobalt transporter CbtA n=2 Tax=Nocardioides panzhihuensis TaxID=860243 RepID=A0A7Z0DKH5_9ACTN|nr:putative cobalt transporter CbtA [Nocardioides panzhihuensis]